MSHLLPGQKAMRRAVRQQLMKATMAITGMAATVVLEYTYP